MRIFLAILALFITMTTAYAQEEIQTMEQNTPYVPTTLRLIYPQWQGGIVSGWMPDIPEEDSSRGYFLGAHLLNFLAPQNPSQKTIEVPISTEYTERKLEKGMTDRADILKQTKSALKILEENNPDKILTLGGECSVSVVPFTYLAKKYNNDVALIWIDAHPDINLPYDDYTGYHAMALTAVMGIGDERFMKLLPAKFDSSKVLIVGLRSWEKGMKGRQERLGIQSLSPQAVAQDSSAVLQWLKDTGASKVVIHFDLDAIDPQEMIAGVSNDPNGLKIDDTIRLINDISSNYDLVGLTIAEPMPRIAIKLRNMMNKLPMFK